MIWKSLRYYWRIHLAVIAAAAITAAVLTGALLVGDSVRGSLRDLSLVRLGKVDHALISERFFRESIANDLIATGEFKRSFNSAVPGILLSGSAVRPDTGARAMQLSIHGVDSRFAALFPDASNLSRLAERPADQIFPSVVINESLQKELNVKAGDQVLFSFQNPAEISPETLLGNRDTESNVRKTRLVVAGILPDYGAGGFTLRPNQTQTMNAFVDLKVVQRLLQQQNNANALYVQGDAINGASKLKELLDKIVTLDDAGIRIQKLQDSVLVETSEVILNPRIENKIQEAASSIQLPAQQVLTYLANRTVASERMTPYSTITALGDGFLWNSLELKEGGMPGQPKDGEVLLNEWAAEDLQVASGDEIAVSYFVVGAGNQLITRTTNLHVSGIVAMKGAALDRKLAPVYPGIEDAENMSEWSPPFPVDLNLIRPKDEKYWDDYRAAPKAIVSLETGQKLWGSRFGRLTSFRIPPAAGNTIEQTEASFAQALKTRITAADSGFIFQPVKQQSLHAASGSTDFGMLFTGFSFFLILSAALLVGLLFRLGVEQRAKELGTLMAMGYPLRFVRRNVLAEGLLLGAAGSIAGLIGACLYAWLMLAGLRTWWSAAVGSSYLFLHVTPLSLIAGAFISLAVIFISIWWGVRQLSQIPIPALLAGVVSVSSLNKKHRLARMIAIGSLLISVALVYFTATQGRPDPALFFGIGACLLISALAFLAIWFRRSSRKAIAPHGTIVLFSMAARNSSRNPGRSLLSSALVASACFVIVAVGANRKTDHADDFSLDSGTGGYTLTAASSIPLYHDPNTSEGRSNLGIVESRSQILKDASIISFRLLPGDDASCLNLYRPDKPRILGVPQEQIRRGGFEFQETIEVDENQKKNPWLLLNQPLANDVIPAIGDYNSVLWILHSGLNKDIVINDESGKPLKLRFVALLKSSLFQSEILISESNFLRHFPGQSGYSYFLIETPKAKAQEVSTVFEESLADYGFDVKSTAAQLAAFHAVENTYLSTFQTLGGLGLLLGTLGLGIVLIRNVIERRSELAAMRAFGFPRKALGTLVLAENAFLLLTGIISGTLAALIAVAPHVLRNASAIPWLSLAVTLLLVIAAGMTSSTAAVRSALRIPLLPALKAE